MIEAAVVIATVPEPWINLIAVEMINGRITIGIAVSASPPAIKLPRPESLMIWPRDPPPPVTNMMIPAEAIPFSISLRAVVLSNLFPNVKIASNKPIPTATTGCPKKIRTSKIPVLNPKAEETVLVDDRIYNLYAASNVNVNPVRMRCEFTSDLPEELKWIPEVKDVVELKNWLINNTTME